MSTSITNNPSASSASYTQEMIGRSLSKLSGHARSGHARKADNDGDAASAPATDLAASTSQVGAQNLASAVADINDPAAAGSATQYLTYNILTSPGTAQDAQSNQNPQNVLSLLAAS